MTNIFLGSFSRQPVLIPTSQRSRPPPTHVPPPCPPPDDPETTETKPVPEKSSTVLGSQVTASAMDGLPRAPGSGSPLPGGAQAGAGCSSHRRGSDKSSAFSGYRSRTEATGSGSGSGSGQGSLTRNVEHLAPLRGTSGRDSPLGKRKQLDAGVVTRRQGGGTSEGGGGGGDEGELDNSELQDGLKLIGGDGMDPGVDEELALIAPKPKRDGQDRPNTTYGKDSSELPIARAMVAAPLP